MHVSDPVLLPEGVTLRAHAEAQMKRHVAQGEPDRFDDRLDGLPALGYEWTDGVNNLATWFVEPKPGVVVRFDHMSLEDPRAEGAVLLAAHAWRT